MLIGGDFSDGYEKYTLEGQITSDAVDWDMTMYHNLHPGSGEDEKEITLKKDAPITLLRWKKDNEMWRKALPEWKSITAGAGDNNAVIPRTNSDPVGLHRDPLFPDETEDENEPPIFNLMASLKKPKLAFVPNDITWLKQYLTMSDRDKGEELARNYPTYFCDYVREHEPELLEQLPFEDDEILEDFSEVPSSLLADFLNDEGDTFMREDPANCPTFMHMSFEKILPNQWLIHKTEDPYGICRDGFTIGMDDYARLGLTTYFKNTSKRGGYNFAFLAKDAKKADGKYGSDAVIFRASGVLVYHYADEEYQVIFNGADAHDIIPVVNNSGEYTLPENAQDNPVFKSESLENIVKWVEQNYTQYRNVIVKRASFE